jgi:hypothetical protein
VFGHSSPRTRYLLSINEETVGGYCELLWRRGVGDYALPALRAEPVSRLGADARLPVSRGSK